MSLPFQARDAELDRRLADIPVTPRSRKLLRIEAERRRRGLSQAALAAAVGLAQTHISAIENGKAPGRAAALKLARFLGLERPELLVEEVR